MEEIRLKRCGTCKIEKHFGEFNKDKSRKCGLQVVCKRCRQDLYIKNKDKILEKNKQYYEQNREKLLEYHKEYIEQNKDKISKYKKEYNHKNRDKRNALEAKRKAQKLKATPPWLTPEHFEEITEFYTICKMFQIYTGLTYHVDHTVPLQGKTVCGLHVPWNLQILEASENISKNNKLLQEEIDSTQ